MGIFNFIKKVMNKEKQEEKQDEKITLTIEPISLETEFKIIQFQHMIKTVRKYLMDKKMSNVSTDSIEYMVKLIQSDTEVLAEIEELLEKGDFLATYQVAYNEIYNS